MLTDQVIIKRVYITMLLVVGVSGPGGGANEGRDPLPHREGDYCIPEDQGKLLSSFLVSLDDVLEGAPCYVSAAVM